MYTFYIHTQTFPSEGLPDAADPGRRQRYVRTGEISVNTWANKWLCPFRGVVLAR